MVCVNPFEKQCDKGTVLLSHFFSEGVNNIVRMHFAKLDSTLNEALDRLSHIKEIMG